MSFFILPNKQKTDELFRAKIKYGQLFLFKYPFGTLIFRPLTILELETILSLSQVIDEIAIEDWIVDTTFIGTEQERKKLIDKSPFLIVKYLASKISLLSTIQEEGEFKKKLLEHRSKNNSLQSVIETLIAKAYKSYNHDDVKNMTQIKQIGILSKSETIAQEQVDISNKKQTRAALRQFTEGATVIGGEDITSPGVADKPEF